MPALSQTNAKKRYYKQTFAIKREGEGDELVRHTLLVNPEDMTVDEPSKTSVTPTLGGAYVTDFGLGMKTVTLQGITGYKARYNADGELRDGYTEFIHLRNMVYRNFLEAQDPSLSMYWYNWEDDEYYRVHPNNFRLMRNKNEPLLYRYEIRFTCLQKLDGANTAKPRYSRRTLNHINLSETGTTLSIHMSGLNEVMSKLT